MNRGSHALPYVSLESSSESGLSLQEARLRQNRAITPYRIIGLSQFHMLSRFVWQPDSLDLPCSQSSGYRDGDHTDRSRSAQSLSFTVSLSRFRKSGDAPSAEAIKDT